MSDPLRTAARMARIAPFHVMELLARAKELEAGGRDIVHMEVGEPDFPTPAAVVEAGRVALAEGRTGYTPALGIPELREAISRHYRDYYGADVPAERIAVTPGASGALQLALGVLLEPGQKVVMTDPGYPCNRHFVRLFDGEPVPLPVGPDENYQLTPGRLADAWDAATRVAMVATPSNPTGTLLDRAQLAALCDTARERGGAVIVDEIYHGLVYGAEEVTAATLADNAIVINSFSKYFGMTGWRLGWLVVPQELIRAVERLAQNIFLAPSTPAQYAALAAFRPEVLEELEDRRTEFARRRDVLLPALRGLGFDIGASPAGAFYLYADSRAFGADSQALARDLLEQAGVAVTPGIDFGDHRPADHLRFAYTTSTARLSEGVERIARHLGRG
jgi:aspartate/methionine/tyrosine aminotransferase